MTSNMKRKILTAYNRNNNIPMLTTSLYSSEIGPCHKIGFVYLYEQLIARAWGLTDH